MEKTPGRLRVNNIDFAISISGHGTPLIWGHGMMANTAAEAQAPWFAWDQLGDVVTVIRYDARGHGQSGASTDPHDYTWASLAGNMLGIADQLNLERFVAGAHLSDGSRPFAPRWPRPSGSED